MKITNQKINLSNAEELSRLLKAQLNSRSRFKLEIPLRDAANGIYAAMKAEIENRGFKMCLDDDTKLCIYKVAEWLTEDDNKRGLLLMGLYGNGKTTMMRAVLRFIAWITEQELGYNKGIKTMSVTAKEIAKMCVSEVDKTRYKALYSCDMLGIDELGGEPKEVMNYGKIETPVIDLLTHRYDKQLITFITTNLNNQELASIYGERIYDRFREMMKIVVFNNKSFRK